MTLHRRMKQMRGNKADIPVLDDGELGVTLDSKEVFVGANKENVQILTVTSTVNSLNNTSITLPLSANQGKELKATIDTVNQKLTTDISDINTKLNQKAPTQLASSTVDGLMSKTDKVKLDGIESGANKTIVVNNLTSTSTTSALSANQGNALNQNIQGINTNLSNHNNKIVSSETGIHGIRYFGSQLQINNPTTNTWDTITVNNSGSTGGDLVIADGSITFNKLEPTLQTRINNFIKLSDIPIASATQNGLMTTADKSKLNSLSSNIKQVEIVDNLFSLSTDKALSAYQGKILRDMITALGYTGSDGGGSGGTGSGEVKLTEGTVYGVAIDQTNPNPSDSVMYIEDSRGFVAGGAWDDIFPFNEITPVLLNEQGIETETLSKNDFSKNINGSPVNITSGDNVMIRIPKIWYNIETIDNTVYVKIAKQQITTHYRCYAHTVDGVEKDYIYVSAYLANLSSNKLKSWSGKSPYVNTLPECRTYAQNNGNGYNLLGFHQITLLQILTLMRSKTLDSQEFYGFGMSTSPTNEEKLTGTKNVSGMYFRGTGSAARIKVMGMEDFYGYYGYWIDGIKTDENLNFKISMNNIDFNTSGLNYTTYLSNVESKIIGWISEVQGSTERGFLPKKANGLEKSYYSDEAALSQSSFLLFGDANGWGATRYGSFRLYFSPNSTTSSGARIMYL